VRFLFKILAPLLFAISAFGQVTNRTATLSWNYPLNELPTVDFYVHQAAEVTNRATFWVVLTNLSGQSLMGKVPVVASNVVEISVRIPIEPGPKLFTVSASNYWGEFFSLRNTK
jgi:hypothetical protein